MLSDETDIEIRVALATRKGVLKQRYEAAKQLGCNVDYWIKRLAEIDAATEEYLREVPSFAVGYRLSEVKAT